MTIVNRTCSVFVALAVFACGHDHAIAHTFLAPQDEPAASPLEDADRSPFDFLVAGGYIHQFDSEPDGFDDCTVDRLYAAVGLNWNMSPDARIMFRVNYGFNSYDFGRGANPFGGIAGQDPWEDINTLEFGVIFSYDASDDVNIFGGPILGFAGETDANWGDSFIGGGVIGASYALSRDLRLGGGVGAISEIEENFKLIFIPVVEWKLSDNWRISTGSASTSANLGVALTGIELIWTISEKWQFSFGGAYAYSRFRLDDEGQAPDGVGEDESWPLWFRLVWNVSDRVQLEGIAGFPLNGELDLENNNGNTIASVDFDGGYFLGVMGSVRF